MSNKLLRCSECRTELGTKIDAIVTLYADQYPSLAQSYHTFYDEEADRRFVGVPCPKCLSDNRWTGSGVRLRTE